MFTPDPGRSGSRSAKNWLRAGPAPESYRRRLITVSNAKNPGWPIAHSSPIPQALQIPWYNLRADAIAPGIPGVIRQPSQFGQNALWALPQIQPVL
jgi:hypothetical protein